MFRIFKIVFHTELKIIWRQGATWFHPIVLFGVIVALFGIGLGFDNQQLMAISPAVIWVAFLIAALFAMDALFANEKTEGTLPQTVLSPYPLWWILLAKATAFWVGIFLPLIAIVPFLGLMMHLSLMEISTLVTCFILGSPALILLGMIGAALTILLAQAGLLLGLLLLPLYIPILILGISAQLSLVSGEMPVFQMTLLAAISTLAITLAPHASAAAIKIAME